MAIRRRGSEASTAVSPILNVVLKRRLSIPKFIDSCCTYNLPFRALLAVFQFALPIAMSTL